MRIPLIRQNPQSSTLSSQRAVPVAVGLLLGAALGASSLAHSAGTVSSITTSDQLSTPFRYTLDGETFTWGIGRSQVMDGFSANGIQFEFGVVADRVELQRDDVSDVSTGIPCGVFVERFGDTNNALQANYPSDGTDSGNCDMAEMLASRVINRGTLDLFANKGPIPKNVERVDYVFDQGVLAPLQGDALSLGGHVVGEKRGNNPVQVATILELDVLGQPARFGPLVRVNSASECTADNVCYGISDIVHNYVFLQNSSTAPQGFPGVVGQSVESVTMAFVSSEQLGLSSGQRYFGVSLFPKDVNATDHVLTDPATFPNDTGDPNITLEDGDGADIYGGVAGYFLASDLAVGTGRVFNDENGNGRPDDNEAGMSDIGLGVFRDSDNNGVYDASLDPQLGDSFDSNISGNFTLPGLPDGSYFLVLDESDPDILPGLELVQGSNPLAFVVSGTDIDGLDFAFSSVVNDPNGGSTAGASTSGASTSGGDTAGSETSGGATSGGATSGTSTSGGATSGTSTSGGDTSGGSTSGSGGTGTTAGGATSGGATSGATTGATAGGATSGTSTAGGDTSGGDTSGTSTSGGDTSGGSTSGATTSGGGETTGTSTSGGSTAGGNTSGTSTSGTSTAGTSTAGTSTSGTSTAGTSTSGTSTAGTSTGGMTTSGTATSGNNTSGTATSGGSTSGSTTSGGATAGTTTTGGATSGTTTSGNPDGMNGGGVPGTGGATMANPDAANIEQGSTVLIPVLDNDVDGSGLGIDITSFTDSPNATISIQDNQISYRPDPDFMGMDTFMYVITDGVGTQATGTVSVAVNRFSDINSNGINDFIECNCTSLTLETGVHGSGVGRVAPLSALVLIVLSLLRLSLTRRRRMAAGV